MEKVKEHISNLAIYVVMIGVSLLFVLGCITSIATWQLTYSNHQLSEQNHALIKSYQAEQKKLSDAGKIQLAFAKNILETEAVICQYLHTLDPNGPACPVFTLPKS